MQIAFTLSMILIMLGAVFAFKEFTDNRHINYCAKLKDDTYAARMHTCGKLLSECQGASAALANCLHGVTQTCAEMKKDDDKELEDKGCPQ